MDYFLTTYAKDYKWPIVTHKKPEANTLQTTLGDSKQKIVDIESNKSMSKTIEGEIVPAQVGAPPQDPGSKFDQPNTYLKKLYTKYPYLYEIMKITPPVELAKKVYMDKYKSVYQEDFSPKGFVEFKTTLENLSQQTMGSEEQDAGMEVCTDEMKEKKKESCACNHDTKYYPCKCAENAHPVRKIAWKPAPISKMVRVPRDKEKKKPEEKKERALPQFKPYKSEYKDTISKIGAVIIKNKLLYPEGTDE